MPEIHVQVGRDVEGPAIAKRVLLAADVAEQYALMLRVKPEAAATATRVKDRLIEHNSTARFIRPGASWWLEGVSFGLKPGYN